MILLQETSNSNKHKKVLFEVRMNQLIQKYPQFNPDDIEERTKLLSELKKIVKEIREKGKEPDIDEVAEKLANKFKIDLSDNTDDIDYSEIDLSTNDEKDTEPQEEISDTQIKEAIMALIAIRNRKKANRDPNTIQRKKDPSIRRGLVKAIDADERMTRAAIARFNKSDVTKTAKKKTSNIARKLKDRFS